MAWPRVEGALFWEYVRSLLLLRLFDCALRESFEFGTDTKEGVVTSAF